MRYPDQISIDANAGDSSVSLPSNSISPSLVKQAALLNVLIFAIVIAGELAMLPAFAASVVLVMFLAMKALEDPERVFFLIFGIKMTFDALWTLKISLPGIGRIGPLELIFIPVLIIMFLGPKMESRSARWPIWLAIVYLVWIAMADVFNGDLPRVEKIIRQGGILFGLVLGYRYLRKKKDIDTLFVLLFVSTIIPVAGSLVQLAVSFAGVSIFHYTIGEGMDLRYAGLYYDPGTTGMMNLVAILSSAYLLFSGIVPRKYLLAINLIIPAALINIVIGGTRSMIIVSLFIVAVLVFRNIKRGFAIGTLIILVAVFFAQPFIDPVIERSQRDLQRDIDISEILIERNYRTMLTGRVGLWQEIWERITKSNWLQQIFGTGLATNAHSTYFFLLLEIGWLGLFLYIFYQLAILLSLMGRQITSPYREIFLLAAAANLLIGITLTTVLYTSFQWFVFMLVGGAMNIKATSMLRENQALEA